MDEKNFIKEKIIGRKEGWKKQIGHYIKIILSAVLFGVISAGIFVISAPFFQSIRNPEETEHVELSTESIEETTIMETEEEEETEAIEEVVQSEIQNYHFSISAYEDMMMNLKQIASDAEKSLVEVTKSVSSSDFLGGETASEDSYSGIILTITDNEVLVFTSAEAVSDDSSKLEISFLRGNRYEASLKAVDNLDGIAVVSVPLKNVMEKDRAAIQAISFGNSKAIKRGDTLIAIGAPAGVLYSSANGIASYLSYNQPAIDSTVEDILADLNADYKKGSFILNTSGELVGWVSGRMGETVSGYCRIAGISDFLSRLEILSNGRSVPYLGMEVQDVTAGMERQGIPAGIYVRACRESGPAYMAGIQAGDIITMINEQEVRSVDNFETELEKTMVDDTISLAVLRQRGQEYVEVDFSVTVGGR